MENSWCSVLLKTVPLVLLAGNAIATDYYFDSHAASAGNGTFATPFKSLASMPTLVSGDVVKLARGSHWDDATIAVSTQVTIESYGSLAAAKPVLSGSRLVAYSDSGLNASEELQDPNDPDSGVITLHTPAGTEVFGVFVNDIFPVYIRKTDANGSLNCSSAKAADRVTPRYWFANYTTKICRASLPATITNINEVRLVTRERVIDLSFSASHVLDNAKRIKISGLDIRYAYDSGVGGLQNASGLNYGKIDIENNDFHGIINTSVCLCSALVTGDTDAAYLTRGTKFEKLKVSGNRFYAYGREAVYVGIAVSSASTDARPIEIIDNVFGEKPYPDNEIPDDDLYLISGWNMSTNAGSEAVDIKRSNGPALVARNVFLLNMKKKAIFIQSYNVEVSRNTINNPFVPGAYSKLSDTHNSAIWHEFEAPFSPLSSIGGGEVKENSISNGTGSGILFRGANGLTASLDSEKNQIYLIEDGTCSTCAGNVDGNSAFVIRAKTGYTFSLADNVARGGKFAIHRFEEIAITPAIDDDLFRGGSGNIAYCNTNLPGLILSSPVCIAGTQDSDGDNVGDDGDNCPALANAGQTDVDLNGIGDVCDLAWQSNDVDGDGIYNTDDNCPSVANGDQGDSDADGTADACENGLTVSYFNDTDTDESEHISALDDKLVAPAVLQRIEPNIDFYYGIGSGPGGGVHNDFYSARFTGRLLVPAYTGDYEFCLKADDGVRLWIDGHDLWEDEHWTGQDSVSDCATVSLTAGQTVPITMEFFDLDEHAIAELKWSWPGHAAEVVPTTSFYAE